MAKRKPQYSVGQDIGFLRSGEVHVGVITYVGTTCIGVLSEGLKKPHREILLEFDNDKFKVLEFK